MIPPNGCIRKSRSARAASRARTGIVLVLSGLVLAVVALAPLAMATAAEKPNFVWIISEDNSKHFLKLFDENGIETPHIEALAEEGITFERAFSNSPVCSVARTTLITGSYAPRLGTQYHRKVKPVTLPEGLRMFPHYLRQAGYYTTNNAKTDYNARPGEGIWDESSRQATWKKRPDPQTPFFHKQTYTQSHESSLHFRRDQMNPDVLPVPPEAVTLFPYHPDTPTFRYTHAYYLHRMQVIDNLVGELVAELERDGLLEDTFIFYFGDHGGVLPGSKGYITEAGVHIPLVVRVPKKWKHLVTLKPGSRTEGFVSFIDFGPTLLHLAGVPVPELMDGRPFLGADISPEQLAARDETFSYTDRFDEKYDFCRALRKGRYKYVRNYQSYYPPGLRNNYRYRMLAYQEWRDLYHAGKLNEIQSRFFEPRPVEALYDVEADPHEIQNLADDPQHQQVLSEMRSLLQAKLKGLPDLSFFPESELIEHAVDEPLAFGRRERERIARLIDVADLSLLPFETARPRIEAALDSEDPWQRYWGLIVCSCFGEQARELVPAAQARLEDAELLVRMRAAEFLGILDVADPRPTLYHVLNNTDSGVEALLTFNSVVYFNDRRPDPYPFDLDQLDMRVQLDLVDRRLSYLRGE
jgi:arylsulfatase A-like enzyme